MRFWRMLLEINLSSSQSNVQMADVFSMQMNADLYMIAHLPS